MSRSASEAGLATLAAGGTAMDAAAATLFAVGVTRPDMCGVGGGGFLVYRSASGRTAALDFRETAPSQYSFGQGVGVGPLFAFGTGHNVVGVPGVVAGLSAAVERFGRLPLSAAVAPAERLAREGITVSPGLAASLQQQFQRLRLYDETSRIYLKQGLSPYEAGERLVQADYARSLRLIGEQGPNAFYRGAIADRIDRAMRASGTLPGDRGTLRAGDFADYRAIWRKPLKARYRDSRIIAMPPPTSGGLATIEMLNLLEGFNVRAAGASSADHLHLLAEAQKIAWADRNAYVADPDFVDVPVATMRSKRYAAVRRQEIDLTRAATYAPGAGAPAAATRSTADAGTHTTHVSAIDRRGNAAAVTCSIEQPMGSAVVAKNTGFLLNNQLTDFDAPGTANGPAPRKRPRSSMSPTIVVRRGKPVLAVGGAGGPSIPMGVTLAVQRLVDFGADVAQAVDAERFEARGACATGGLALCVEDGRIAPGVLDDLAARGHEIIRLGEYATSPLLQAVGVDLRTGERLATADPRNEGAPTDPEADGALARP